MDLVKLTVQGFKSFYDKSTFTFLKNISAIVGPNGSGKSNITEAIRFVLGEQSIKNIRGKDVTDLLYRGNNVSASKATVTVEFVKNKKSKNFHQNFNIDNIFVKNALEKDTVIISRTLFLDGKSIYTMNGVEVRLKDINEFLLYIHLGNKSSWHISQGEADRVLVSSREDRKTLIEDALGLKVYHARINESLKKIEKTKENIKEAGYKRKELIPELTALQRQVERIEKAESYKQELLEKGNLFLSYKQNLLNQEMKHHKTVSSAEVVEKKLHEIKNKLKLSQKNLYTNSGDGVSSFEMNLEKEEKVLQILLTDEKDLNEKINYIKNNLSVLNIDSQKSRSELIEIVNELNGLIVTGNDLVFSERDVLTTGENISERVEKILQEVDLEIIKKHSQETDREFKKLITKGSVVTKDNIKQITYLQQIKNRLTEKLESIDKQKNTFEQDESKVGPKLEQNILKLNIVRGEIENIKKQILEFKLTQVETEKEIQTLLFEEQSLRIQLEKSEDEEKRISMMDNEFKLEQADFVSFLGKSFIFKFDENILSAEEFINIKRQIDRLKIRLEESIVDNPKEIISNFENMKAKDLFLLSEINDLNLSMQNLENLIKDLKENLKREFESGLISINSNFDNYIQKLFGGGGGRVFVTAIERKNQVEMEEVQEEKFGIEVEVEIPKKKIKGMQSLSGGERALVSIALNFSIINQNPAPFMILDETDATLDEANAKRYGELLEMLKLQTKLIVVTHNRETMHFAEQVYGVTLSKDGHSKILSISFEDAIVYAK